MTRTAIRHTLSALAAAAVVTAFASGPALCQPSSRDTASSFKIFTLADALKQKAPKARGWQPSDADIQYSKQGLPGN